MESFKNSFMAEEEYYTSCYGETIAVLIIEED